MAYGRRFGGGPRRGTRSRVAVKESRGVQAKSRTPCWGCGQNIEIGMPFIRLRLRKDLCQPQYSFTGTKPKGSMRFHDHCVPADRNKAMNYDITKDPTNGVPPPPPSRHNGGAVPPPPKPLSSDEVVFAAFVAIQAAVKARARNNPAFVAETEKIFKTFQGLTARSLRPGTPEEGVVAMKMALRKAIDMVF